MELLTHALPFCCGAWVGHLVVALVGALVVAAVGALVEEDESQEDEDEEDEDEEDEDEEDEDEDVAAVGTAVGALVVAGTGT